jgi:DNA-binding transcriptional regulator YdaS (Cro superfamily)
MNKKIAAKAVKLLGGPTQAARRLAPYTQPGKPRLTQAAVWNWSDRGAIPVEYAIPIEKELEGKVHRSQLRPDIYPPEEYPQHA